MTIINDYVAARKDGIIMCCRPVLPVALKELNESAISFLSVDSLLSIIIALGVDFGVFLWSAWSIVHHVFLALRLFL